MHVLEAGGECLSDVESELDAEVEASTDQSGEGQCAADVNDAAQSTGDSEPLNDDEHIDEQVRVHGEVLEKLPDDLYIPPDALCVILEAFEGPLDLLLYLIRRQNLDILDIPVAEITEQYMGYVELMRTVNFELAAEYLVMAAMLGEIKSRCLLPRPPLDENGEECDPRAELIRRLQEYEQIKNAAEDIDELPRIGRDVFLGGAKPPEYERPVKHPDVDMRELLLALNDVMHRADLFASHNIEREVLSTRERMSNILDGLKGKGFVVFQKLFTLEEGRAGVVVTFLAILELVKESLLELVQAEPFAAIHVRVRQHDY